MKHMIYGVEIVTMFAVAAQPTIAQAVGMDPMNGWSQLGVISILSGLLWWQTAKVVPDIQRIHAIEINRTLQAYATHSTNMTNELKGLRKDAEDQQKEWCQKLDDRPCLGLEGMMKLREEIEANCHEK